MNCCRGIGPKCASSTNQVRSLDAYDKARVHDDCRAGVRRWDVGIIRRSRCNDHGRGRRDHHGRRVDINRCRRCSRHRLLAPARRLIPLPPTQQSPPSIRSWSACSWSASTKDPPSDDDNRGTAQAVPVTCVAFLLEGATISRLWNLRISARSRNNYWDFLGYESS